MIGNSHRRLSITANGMIPGRMSGQRLINVATRLSRRWVVSMAKDAAGYTDQPAIGRFIVRRALHPRRHEQFRKPRTRLTVCATGTPPSLHNQTLCLWRSGVVPANNERQTA
jgi:hypothetical protein